MLDCKRIHKNKVYEIVTYNFKVYQSGPVWSIIGDEAKIVKSFLQNFAEL